MVAEILWSKDVLVTQLILTAASLLRWANQLSYFINKYTMYKVWGSFIRILLYEADIVGNLLLHRLNTKIIKFVWIYTNIILQDIFSHHIYNFPSSFTLIFGVINLPYIMWKLGLIDSYLIFFPSFDVE